MMRALVMAAAALLLPACTADSVSPLPPGWENAVKPTGTAEITFEPEGARALSEVMAVNVRLLVSGVSGRGTVDAEFLAPGPAAYDRHTRAVEATPSEQRELVFGLPVAGTNIPVHGLDGRWEVRFFLDGAPLTTTTFTLER